MPCETRVLLDIWSIRAPRKTPAVWRVLSQTEAANTSIVACAW